jgi:hypothetical protein
MELARSQELHPISYNWDFLPSAQLDNASLDVLDLFFQSPANSPSLNATHLTKRSDSEIPQTNLRDKHFYPLANELASARSSVSSSSSVQSDDVWHAEGTISNITGIPSTAVPGEAKMTDRRHRRREQNRKAQSNFRQKRKEEVRHLEREVRQLREQLADFHKRGPIANLSICTQCRKFYPAGEGKTAHPTATQLFS